MPELNRVPWAVVDIATDDELIGRYGTRIPVLVSGPAELAWPFNADDVVELIAAQP